MGDTHWREIESFPALPVLGNLDTRDDGVYLSGTLNWLGIHNINLDTYWDDEVTLDLLSIVSLDLGKETYKQLLLPDGLDEVPHVNPVLGVLKDCLCLSVIYKRTHIVFWQMKEFGDANSWTQLLNVGLLQIECFPFGEARKPIVPMCMSEDGHVVMVLNEGDCEVILYDCRDNEVQRARIPNEQVWVEPKDYIQSLVQPL